MNSTEIAALLAKVQLDDNREITREVITRWTEILGPIEAPIQDLLEAVNMHRRETVAYLQPAHITANLHRIRETRAASHALDDGRSRTYRGAPKPRNFDAMAAAWNDPVRFHAEVAKYRAQVADEAAR